jgi:hypothetical protein
MRKTKTRKRTPKAAYSVHIDLARVKRLQKIARAQLIEPSIAELVRVVLDRGMAEVELDLREHGQ